MGGGAWIGFRARGGWEKKGEPVRHPRVISAVESATERDHCDRSGPRGQSRNRFSSRSRSNGRTAGHGSILRTTTARVGACLGENRAEAELAQRARASRTQRHRFVPPADEPDFRPIQAFSGHPCRPTASGLAEATTRESPARAGSLRPTATGDFRFTGGIKWITLTPVIPGTGDVLAQTLFHLHHRVVPGAPHPKDPPGAGAYTVLTL